MITKISRRRRSVFPVVYLLAFFLFPGALSAWWPGDAHAQEFTPEMLKAASQRTGLSEEELLRRYQQNKSGTQTPTQAGQAESEPGRTSLEQIDDSAVTVVGQVPWRDTSATAILPFDSVLATELAAVAVNGVVLGDTVGYFGGDFFHLDSGVFTPPSFGPVAGDYRLGVGDEIIINAWGGIDFQITRVVDRDGAIILPRSGKIPCAGRTLAEVDQSIRVRLAESHSSIRLSEGAKGTDTDEGDTIVEVTLGHLRSIKVFVVGAVTRPGSYELNSASRILTALAAAGGPTLSGSMRQIRLVRGEKTIAEMDLYDYLLGGSRVGDARLQEGDTVFIPDIGPSVRIRGQVRRALYYELLPGETLTDLIGFAGGFTATAAAEVIHLERILPAGERLDSLPDKVYVDVAYDATEMAPADGKSVVLLDGDEVQIDATEDRLDNWVEVKGKVKRPGRYEFSAGMTALSLIELAGGLWPDALTERAVVDRTSEDLEFSTFAFSLADELSGTASPSVLQAKDVLHVFSRWEIQERPQVYISGDVFEPLQENYRQGMTLRDLILKAGGLKQSADLVRVEVARLRGDAVRSRDLDNRPNQTVDVLEFALGEDFLTAEESLVLEPWDRVNIRRLPWWEMQKTVTVRGEVFYAGQFSLERKDERLSSV
ncbi:MAG: SLBB domain-containing protein, partial [Gemmatimonadales bacterium]|nr:SLBB domain-containing protein [Gemmatimonadales bacterium]